MAMGPGKYDPECSALREQLDAAGVLVVVLNGNRGTGFSASLTGPVLMALPQILRQVADEIERSGGSA